MNAVFFMGIRRLIAITLTNTNIPLWDKKSMRVIISTILQGATANEWATYFSYWYTSAYGISNYVDRTIIVLKDDVRNMGFFSIKLK